MLSFVCYWVRLTAERHSIRMTVSDNDQISFTVEQVLYQILLEQNCLHSQHFFSGKLGVKIISIPLHLSFHKLGGGQFLLFINLGSHMFICFHFIELLLTDYNSTINILLKITKSQLLLGYALINFNFNLRIMIPSTWSLL